MKLLNKMPLPLLALSFAGFVACGGKPPVLLPIGDQSAVVGEAMTLELAASDPDSSTLSFSADPLPAGASLDTVSGTQARFRWVPTASQAGDKHIDFSVTDGHSKDTERVVITVAGGSGQNGPEFVGQSTWILEADQKSIQKTIEVRDDSASSIDWVITGNPDGSTFSPLIKRAVFFWEPTTLQRQQAQYTFTVSATNPSNQKSKDQVFTILIRSGGTSTCTTAKPVITSTTQDPIDAANDFSLAAEVTDAESKVQSVSISYAFGATPAPADFINVDMVAGAGSSWEAAAHRTTDLAAGEFDTLTYEICATDDDDPNGASCDQQACSGKLTTTVRMAGGKGLCEVCAGDPECGSVDDHCVTTVGTTPFCGVDCSNGGAGGGGCPSGYGCTDLGAGLFQCTPASQSCSASSSPAATPGDLIINEVLADPAAGSDANGDAIFSTTADEFVEIVSVAPGTLDLGGVTLSDSKQVRFTFPVGTTIASELALVVFGGGNTADFTGLGNATVFAASSNPNAGTLSLNNGGDQVQLRTPGGAIIDAMSYGPEGGMDTSLTLDQQAGGIVYVKHSQATGASTPFSPGQLSCGGNFPVTSANQCGGTFCGDKMDDTDQEPNDAPYSASCVFNIGLADVTGDLMYQGGNLAASPDPWDYYVFWGAGGTSYELQTFEVSPSTKIDTALSILDATGTELVFADDTVDANGGLVSLYSHIPSWTAPADGTYYVVISTYQGVNDQIGEYNLISISQ